MGPLRLRYVPSLTCTLKGTAGIGSVVALSELSAPCYSEVASLKRVTTQTQPGATWPGDTASETCRSAELVSANSTAGRSKDASVGSGIAAPCAWSQNWYLNTTDAGGLRVTKTSAGTMRACRFGRPFLLDTVWCGVVSLESA